MLEPPAHEGLIGQVLAGQYKVVRLLAGGGMGRVYVAEQIGTGREVGLKVLRAEAMDETNQRRFLREGEILARLQHPNIVTVFGVGTMPDGNCFLAMEYLRGDTLALALRDGPLPLPRLLRVGEQLARALVAAHHQGIVHRDLKPQNVMLVDAPGEDPDVVKVLDFGIARSAGDDEEGLTHTGTVIGTPEYLSPEQAAGRPVDTRTDLYSLGLILYRAATGQPAIHSSTPLGYLSAHVVEKPVPISRVGVGASLPAVLARTIMELLAKDPEKRPDAARVLEVFKDLRARSEPARDADGPRGRARFRRRALLAAAAGLVIPAVVWLVATLAAGPRSPSPDAPAVRPPEAVPVATPPAPAPPGPEVETPVAMPTRAPDPMPAAAVIPAVRTPPAPPVRSPAARPARAEKPREADADRSCTALVGRLNGALGVIARDPADRPRACRTVRERVHEAETQNCRIPPDVGARAVECL